MADIDLSIYGDRAGIIYGSSAGGWGAFESTVFESKDHSTPISPLLIMKIMSSAAAAQVAIKWGLHGPCETISAACASGAHALVNAWGLIASGRCDVVLAGGCDSIITPVVMDAFLNSGSLSPTSRSRPFAVDRDGFSLSEGAGMLVLESMDNARTRSAHILGRMKGGWNNCDAYHISAPIPDGTWSSSCMASALNIAGIEPEEVSWINAHGTGTPLNDAAEATAIRKVFTSRVPPITSLKGSTGHTVSGAGALEAVASVLSFSMGQIPPTVTDSIDPAFADMDIVTEFRSQPPGIVLSNSFGFGGQNSCVVLAPDGSQD